MQQKIVELYEPERVARLEKRCLIVKRLLWILALTVLGVCIYLTTRVNTRNIYRLLLTCICVSVPAAWIILYFGKGQCPFPCFRRGWVRAKPAIGSRDSSLAGS